MLPMAVSTQYNAFRYFLLHRFPVLLTLFGKVNVFYRWVGVVKIQCRNTFIITTFNTPSPKMLYTLLFQFSTLLSQPNTLSSVGFFWSSRPAWIAFPPKLSRIVLATTLVGTKVSWSHIAWSAIELRFTLDAVNKHTPININAE